MLLGFFAGSIYAQDDNTIKLKNEGNDALRAKNYKLAAEKLEEYLKAINFKGDDASIYNVAFAANKVKDYTVAEKFFDMSIKNNYKVQSSYMGKASAQKAQNKTDEFLKTLQDGIKALPGKSSDLEKTYAVHFLKSGQDFQKKNNIAKAAESYEMITKMNSSSYQSRGYLSLGTLYFNNGAAILQKATPIATTNREQYESEKKKALSEFNKAKEYLMKATNLTPNDQEVKDTLIELNAAISNLNT